MNKFLKTVLLGVIAWAVPFVASFFVWDVNANAPSVSAVWFYALMSITGAIGFAVAAYLQFKNIRKDTVRQGFLTGITWYIELSALDLIVLVGLFGMTMTDYYHLLITYLTPMILCIAVGYIKK